jgi:hypothetical protein
LQDYLKDKNAPLKRKEETVPILLIFRLLSTQEIAIAAVEVFFST